MIRFLFLLLLSPCVIGCFGDGDSGGTILGGGSRYDNMPVVDLRVPPEGGEFQVVLMGEFHDDLLVCIALSDKYAYRGLTLPEQQDGLSLSERRSFDEFWVLIPAGNRESLRFSLSSVMKGEYFSAGDDASVDIFIKSDFIAPVVGTITTLGGVVVPVEQYRWHRYQVYGSDLRVAVKADD